MGYCGDFTFVGLPPVGQRLHIRVHKQHTEHDVCSFVRTLGLPLPGADLVDYLEPNELQLEEPFPRIWNP